jgi:hypothetical protein
MDVDYGQWVSLYQSKIYKDEFPAETALFTNVVFTEPVGSDFAASVTEMRARMIAETDYYAAVFIGGMSGIRDEYDMLKQKPGRPIKMIPIVTTGGATQTLAELEPLDPALSEELDYVALLFEQLRINPNERRYRTLEEQPRSVGERIHMPQVPPG